MLAAIFVAVLAAFATESKYTDDFRFLADTISQKSAAVKVKKIDWKKECDRLEPKFEACRDDAEHMKNVMELLAVLHDSHSDLWETKVARDRLPSKWLGQFGGGLWLGFDAGRFWIQGVVANHPAGPQLEAGSLLLSVNGEPTWFAMERARRRIARFSGISSDRSLFASLSNAGLPFGDEKGCDIQYLTPKNDVRTAKVGRFGPDGQPYRFDLETLPEGVETHAGAIAKLLATPFCKKLGYLRITGGQDAATVKAFHLAFDSLQGMEALVLDGRAMGGGSDDCAWEMVGRLFPKGADNGRHGRIEPSGTWQFDGPVVFLQDELMVSSAETFAWAVTETDRLVSVGRATGGWGIVPNIFDLPSGLGKVRIGLNARPTPIRGVQTESVGWPADVAIPYGPAICARRDPVYAIGLEVLAVLKAGSRVADTRKLFGDLAAGRLKEFEAAGSKLAAKARGFEPKALAKLFRDDLEASIAAERAALDQDALPPDAIGATARLPDLIARATAAGLVAPSKALDAKVKALKAEAAAEAEFLDLADDALRLDDKAAAAFQKKHGKTTFGKWLGARAGR